MDWDCNKKFKDFALPINPNLSKEEQLKEKETKLKELIEYYQIFNDFNSQSDNLNIQSIYKDKLNPRDAWSKLIITFANTNVEFVRSCNIDGKSYGYEFN